MRIFAGLLVAGCVAFAQEKSPAFEVASIRPAGPIQPQAKKANPGGRGAALDPSLVNYPRISMKSLLLQAFHTAMFQLIAPNWTDSEFYEIHAKIPEGVSRDQIHLMLQNLLIERFGLAFHRETRDLPAYELVIAKGGLKMKESGPASGTDLEFKETDRGPVLVTTKDSNGYTQLPPGRKGMILMAIAPGILRNSGREQTMEEIVTMCRNRLQRPIIDKTGLTGTYDFNLDYSSGGPTSQPPNPSTPIADAPEPAPPFEVALELLGLKLQPVKAPVEMIVVDKLEKVATGN